MIIAVKKSKRKDKKYTAFFKNGSKTHFGQDSSKTYLDHKDKAKRDAYHMRHAKDLVMHEDFPYRPGFLSYRILWGESTNLRDAVKTYNKRYFGELEY